MSFHPIYSASKLAPRNEPVVDFRLNNQRQSVDQLKSTTKMILKRPVGGALNPKRWRTSYDT